MTGETAPAPEDKPELADGQEQASEPTRQRRVIKIGSQRDGDLAATEPSQPMPTEAAQPSPAEADEDRPVDGEGNTPVEQPAERAEIPAESPATAAVSFPPPRLDRVSDDLQKEIDEALADVSLDELISTSDSKPDDEPQIDSRYPATVVKVAPEYVFFSLPGFHEGAAPLRHFAEVPEPGTVIDVLVSGFKQDERLYELTIPGASVDVGDWSDLDEGITVEVRVTGHNTGGLECEVNSIRGFIPMSQIALYRIENLAEFVDQKFACIVTEANPARRNLVLSRRAVLERERAEEKEKLMQSLEVGQQCEGVVSNIRDFGAFVDLGGVDGLVHISKLSWDRVAHPSEVLEEGQKVKVKIEKIDEATGKISLSYRDLLEHPWTDVDSKYPANAIVTGTVSKIMDFGAFVRLEAGVEGLVHISELAHHRVSRVDSVVREGQEISVKVLAVDTEAQKMSLSLKAAQMPSQKATKQPETDEETDDESAPEPSIPRRQTPLKGGVNKNSGGEQFGLKW